MSRLWLRLFLAFGVVALIAVGSVALLVNWSSQNLFETYVHQSLRARGEAVAPVLEQYYATYGAWQGVDALLEGLAGVGRGAPGMMMGRGRGMMGGSALSGVAGGRWLLADGNGQVLADTAGPVSGGGLSAAQQERAISLEVNGQRVGWLVPQITLSEQASLEAQYLQAVNRATLWAGGAAALAAMLLAWVLVRSITAPLRDLTQATEALAGGDLARRVAVRGSDEINDLARSFNAMAQSLQEQTTLRRHMVADIAHELRTPLSVLRGNLEAMLDGVYPLSTDNIAVAHHQTLHLNRLVEDLRLLALAEAGALELQRVAVDLNDLVRESGQAFEAVADDAAVTLEVVPAETPLPLLADRQRLRQVCFNLLQNALQHTPAGGRITLRAWRGDQPPVPLPPAVAEALASGAWQVLEVSDTGQGIPAEDLPHIFERFRRGSQAAPGSGSGLGLAIARQLTLAHGGQIIAQSVLGQGTTFCVLLPAVDEA